jgi:hypothetical protein
MKTLYSNGGSIEGGAKMAMPLPSIFVKPSTPKVNLMLSLDKKR